MKSNDISKSQKKNSNTPQRHAIKKPKYTPEELLGQSPKDSKNWPRADEFLNAPPVGKEIIDW